MPRLLTLLLPFALWPVFAHAEAAPGQFVAVHMADLDLASGVGVAELDRRIVAAVETLCGGDSVFDLVGQNEAQSCRASAMTDAMAQRDRLLTHKRDVRRLAFSTAR